MQVYDADRRPLPLDGELARGGEAVVYRVRGRPDLVAKVYTKRRAGYEHKLHWMLANPPPDPSRGQGHAAIAWPADLVRDVNGRLVGFTMPYVPNAVPILKVFNPRLRARVLPDFDRRYLHRTARNLALAVAALHGRGYVVGDLNQSNVLVTARALVTLIDTDSFQVQEHRPSQIVTYPCPVGKPEYTAPELQGQAYGGLIRLPEHDLFGLAVLIFQLLFEGSHPFRSTWRVDGDPPPLEAKITRGLYPYARPAPAEVAPPPGLPDLDLVYPELAERFDLALGRGHSSPRSRPPAEDWARTMAAAEDALVSCTKGHVHGDHLPRCPVCGARSSRVKRRTTTTVSSPAAPAPLATVSPRAPLAGLAAALTWPGRVLAKTLTEGINATTQGLRGGLRTLWTLALRRAVIGLGLAPAQPAVGGRHRRLLRRTTGVALLAGLVAAAAGLVTGMTLTAPAASLGATPVSVAALSGGLALTAAALFRGLGERLDGGLAVSEVAAALLRALAMASGWALAWLTAYLVDALVGLPGGIVDPGATLGPAAMNDGPAWLVACLVYGAVSGAVGAPNGAAVGRWLFAGLVFGTVAWLAVDIVLSLS